MWKSALPFSFVISFYSAAAAEELPTFYLGSLGDSISAGFNAGGPLDQRDKSWSAGTSIESHAVRIKNQLGSNVVVKNASKSGAKIEDIAAQTQKLVSDNFAPDYVTYLIGANDVCGGSKTPGELAALGKKTLEDSLSLLKKANPQVKVLVAAVPNLLYLNELLKSDAQCVSRWKAFNICGSFMAGNIQEKNKGLERWRSYNQMLSQFADDHPENVKFSSKSGDRIFLSKDVSRIDCFHPSIEGQKTLSEMTWGEGWFANGDSN
ncbi:MAG: SGNH/GDSL hydrolase family protein [Pseudomonadota bacterium]